MTITNLKRLQVLRYSFKNFPKSNSNGHLGQIGKRFPKKRYGWTSYSGGIENGLVGRAYLDGAPQKITMAIANRAESAIFKGLASLRSPPNLFDLAFRVKKIKTKYKSFGYGLNRKGLCFSPALLAIVEPLIDKLRCARLPAR